MLRARTVSELIRAKTQHSQVGQSRQRAGEPRAQRQGRPAAQLDDFAWLVEELRVQTFAPELKTAVPVSPQRVQEAWAKLAR